MIAGESHLTSNGTVKRKPGRIPIERHLCKLPGCTNRVKQNRLDCCNKSHGRLYRELTDRRAASTSAAN